MKSYVWIPIVIAILTLTVGIMQYNLAIEQTKIKEREKVEEPYYYDFI